jgi:hypothetical protein
MEGRGRAHGTYGAGQKRGSVSFQKGRKKYFFFHPGEFLTTRVSKNVFRARHGERLRQLRFH